NHVRREEIVVAQIMQRTVERAEHRRAASEEGERRTKRRGPARGEGRPRVRPRQQDDPDDHVHVDFAAKPGECGRHRQRPKTRNSPVSVITATASSVASTSGATKRNVSTRES